MSASFLRLIPPVSSRPKTTSSNSFTICPGENLPRSPPRAAVSQVEYLRDAV
jgi:hypothetical protein